MGFDSNGNKTAMATYDNGQKSENGFLNDTVLSEVDYSNNLFLLKLANDALVIAE
jgi:hypothetical protein